MVAQRHQNRANGTARKWRPWMGNPFLLTRSAAHHLRITISVIIYPEQFTQHTRSSTRTYTHTQSHSTETELTYNEFRFALVVHASVLDGRRRRRRGRQLLWRSRRRHRRRSLFTSFVDHILVTTRHIPMVATYVPAIVAVAVEVVRFLVPQPLGRTTRIG